MIEKTALRLLSLRSCSIHELRKKLIRKGFNINEIEPVLEKYHRLGFLNDEDLAVRRVEGYKKRGYGPHRIAGKLKQQGLKSSSYPVKEQEAAILRLIKTPIFLRKSKPQLIAALQRRGFDLEAIFKVLRLSCESSLA